MVDPSGHLLYSDICLQYCDDEEMSCQITKFNFNPIKLGHFGTRANAGDFKDKLLKNISSDKFLFISISSGPKKFQKLEFWKSPIKVGKILKGNLDSIPSPSLSVKIQIMGGKICLRCKGKTLLDFVDNSLKQKVC